MCSFFPLCAICNLGNKVKKSQHPFGPLKVVSINPVYLSFVLGKNCLCVKFIYGGACFWGFLGNFIFVLAYEIPGREHLAEESSLEGGWRRRRAAAGPKDKHHSARAV